MLADYLVLFGRNKVETRFTPAALGPATNMSEHIKGRRASLRNLSGLYSSSPQAETWGQMATVDTGGVATEG